MAKRKTNGLTRAGAPVVSSLLAALLLALGLLAASGKSHEVSHRSESGGLCAACLLAHGQLEATGLAFAVVLLSSPLLYVMPLSAGVVPLASDCAFSPSRAPPLGLPSFAVAD